MLKLHPSDMPAFLRRMAAEIRDEYGMQAHVEPMAALYYTDHCGRLVVIGRETDSTLRADVYTNAERFNEGVLPAQSDHLQGDTIPLLVNHAMAIAARVALDPIR